MIKELFENNLWKELKPYCFKEEVANQSKVDGPRHRRKISGHIPGELLKKGMKIRIECAACGRKMKPVMFSEKRNEAYLNVVCSFGNHKEGWGCARTKKASIEASILDDELKEGEPSDPRQQEIPF